MNINEYFGCLSAISDWWIQQNRAAVLPTWQRACMPCRTQSHTVAAFTQQSIVDSLFLRLDLVGSIWVVVEKCLGKCVSIGKILTNHRLIV